jgi:hypothetical protein
MTITKIATATLVAVSFASASFAGTLTEPMVDVVEAPVEGSSASSNGSGILLPLLGLALVAALVASDDS